MSEVSLLDLLESELFTHYFMVNKAKNEVRKVFENVDVVHVGELTQCRLRVQHFAQITSLDEYVRSSRGRRVSPMFLGTIVEYGFRSLVKGRVKVLDNVLKFKKLTLSDGRSIVIVGSPDFVIEVNGKYIPVEVKWSSSHFNLQEHYEVQAKLYAWLFDSDEAKVVVFSPNGFAEYTVDAFSDEEVEHTYIEWLKKTPRWDWECKICPISNTCTTKKIVETTGKLVKIIT